MRPPQGKNHQGDTQPSPGFHTQVRFLAGHVVDDVVESAEPRDSASDAGRGILVFCHIDADRVRCRGILADSPQVEARPGPEKNPAGSQGDDDCQEEQHTPQLEAVLPPGKRPSVIVTGAHQVNHRVQLGHDHLGQADTKGGQRQAGHVLVGPQGYRQERIDQSGQHGKRDRAKDAQDHNQERRQAALSDHVQHEAAARAAHAHDAWNAQVQVSGFFGQDFTGGAVHEYSAKCQ